MKKSFMVLCVPVLVLLERNYVGTSLDDHAFSASKGPMPEYRNVFIPFSL